MENIPEFIASEIEKRNTSLGDNGIFGGNTVPLTSILLKNRYKQIIKSIEEIFGYIPTVDEAKTKLSKLVYQCVEKEKPLKNQLETLCESIVNQILGIPQETLLINCELVKNIQPYNSLRITPEYDENNFNVLGELPSKDDILKRRAINSMIQGISYLLMTATYDNEKLNSWSQDLPNLYKHIIALNDYLIFSEKEDISDENPMLGAYVETNIGKSDEKTVIDSQGLIYPFLLQETYRGVFEMFGTHGLPNDIENAMYIMRRADFTLAEAWDIRIGVPIWQEIDKCLDDKIEPSVYPYLFSSIVELDCDEFNKLLFDVFNKKEEAKEWFKDIINFVEHDKEYQTFKSDIERFNFEKCLLTDGEDNIIQ